jgi:uroporphyrinogen decarboxylase
MIKSHSSDLQKFYDTVEHRVPEQILYYFEATEDLDNRLRLHLGLRDWKAHYGCFQPIDVCMVRPDGQKVPDYSRYWRGQELPKGTKFDAFGVAMVPSGFYHFWGYISPLRNATTIKDIEDYPIEDVSDWDASDLKERVKLAHTQGRVTRGWVGHMYESAWQIRGYEQFLMDMIEHPTWAECLLERIMQQNLIRARVYADAGVDLIMTGDDVANQKSSMFAIDVWKRMILSRWQKVWAEIKRVNPAVKIWYHSDGNIMDLLGDIVDGGVDILNPLQPECLDIDRVYRDFGKIISFDGCIGTQSTMPFGSPGDVQSRVNEVIEKYGRNGGLIISPTHVLEPEVPIANIEAFCCSCKMRK